MATRREVTKQYARKYGAESKKERGRMLDEPEGAAWVVQRKPRPRTYGYDTLRLLIRVWMFAGQPAGKYLAATMALWLPLLAEAGDLDKPFATPGTITEIGAMSAATIDRYLAPARRSMQLRGSSTTTPAPVVLRNSIGLSKAGRATDRAWGGRGGHGCVLRTHVRRGVLPDADDDGPGHRMD